MWLVFLLGREGGVRVHHMDGDVGDEGDVRVVSNDGLEVVKESVVVVHLVHHCDSTRPFLNGKRNCNNEYVSQIKIIARDFS